MLVPAALTAYYRKSAAIEWDFENRSAFQYIVRGLIFPVLFIATMALLLWPVVDLMSDQLSTRDPIVLTIQALIGICGGVAVSAVGCKAAPLRAIFHHRWTAILTLLLRLCGPPPGAGGVIAKKGLFERNSDILREANADEAAVATV